MNVESVCQFTDRPDAVRRPRVHVVRPGVCVEIHVVELVRGRPCQRVFEPGRSGVKPNAIGEAHR